MITLEEENKTENHEWEGIGNFPILCSVMPVDIRKRLKFSIV